MSCAHWLISNCQPKATYLHYYLHKLTEYYLFSASYGVLKLFEKNNLAEKVFFFEVVPSNKKIHLQPLTPEIVLSQYAHNVVLTSKRRRFNVMDVVQTSKRCCVRSGMIFHISYFFISDIVQIMVVMLVWKTMKVQDTQEHISEHLSMLHLFYGSSKHKKNFCSV